MRRSDFVRRLVGDQCDACDRPTRVLHGVRPLSPALCSRCWSASRRQARARITHYGKPVKS